MAARKKKLRLVKVMVQSFFVVDDGEHLSEQMSEPVTVPAEDWPDFIETLEKGRRVKEQELNAEGEPSE